MFNFKSPTLVACMALCMINGLALSPSLSADERLSARTYFHELIDIKKRPQPGDHMLPYTRGLLDSESTAPAHVILIYPENLIDWVNDDVEPELEHDLHVYVGALQLNNPIIAREHRRIALALNSAKQLLYKNATQKSSFDLARQQFLTMLGAQAQSADPLAELKEWLEERVSMIMVNHLGGRFGRDSEGNVHPSHKQARPFHREFGFSGSISTNEYQALSRGGHLGTLINGDVQKARRFDDNPVQLDEIDNAAYLRLTQRGQLRGDGRGGVLFHAPGVHLPFLLDDIARRYNSKVARAASLVPTFHPYAGYSFSEGNQSLAENYFVIDTPRVGIVVINSTGTEAYRGAGNLYAEPPTDTLQTRALEPDQMYRLPTGPETDEPFTLKSTTMALILHEARHSDGNGELIGFPHVSCPRGHTYEGHLSCDAYSNGANGIARAYLLMAYASLNQAERQALGKPHNNNPGTPDEKSYPREKIWQEIILADQADRVLNNQAAPERLARPGYYSIQR